MLMVAIMDGAEHISGCPSSWKDALLASGHGSFMPLHAGWAACSLLINSTIVHARQRWNSGLRYNIIDRFANRGKCHIVGNRGKCHIVLLSFKHAQAWLAASTRDAHHKGTQTKLNRSVTDPLLSFCNDRNTSAHQGDQRCTIKGCLVLMQVFHGSGLVTGTAAISAPYSIFMRAHFQAAITIKTVRCQRRAYRLRLRCCKALREARCAATLAENFLPNASLLEPLQDAETGQHWADRCVIKPGPLIHQVQICPYRQGWQRLGMSTLQRPHACNFDTAQTWQCCQAFAQAGSGRS